MASVQPTRPRPRRKSSLGGELRGDNTARALSTMDPPSPMLSPPLSPRTSQFKASRPNSKRRKARTLLRRWKDFSFRHTWVTPLVLITIILLLYAINPNPSNPIHYGLFLAYRLPADHPHLPYHAHSDRIYYGKGPLDFAFVSFYIIVLSFTREFLMQRLIRPLAIYSGIRSRAKQNRFMEQVYTAIYFSIFGPLGLYVMRRTPVWYFNTAGMFEGFPHRSHEGIFKAYYLLQASYWAQQAIVLCLQLEKPRKDFKELVGHHVVTLALIWLSYRFHFTYMGVAVYITHDISDFFLATAKTLNYLDSPITVPYFSFFVFVWIYLRHYINLVILSAVLLPTGNFRTVGPFDLNWDTQQYKCWISQYITFALLASLQSINLFWLWFILKIAWNALMTDVQKDVRDVRSDDEEEEEEEEDEKVKDKGAGRVSAKANGIANGQLHGAAAPEGHESYRDAVIEGKKEK